MKHIVKQVAILSLALMLLVVLLPVGVAAADTDTAADNTTADAPTESADPTEPANSENAPEGEKADVLREFLTKFWAAFFKFFDWFRVRVNLVFDLI